MHHERISFLCSSLAFALRGAATWGRWGHRGSHHLSIAAFGLGARLRVSSLCSLLFECRMLYCYNIIWIEDKIFYWRRHHCVVDDDILLTSLLYRINALNTRLCMCSWVRVLTALRH